MVFIPPTQEQFREYLQGGASPIVPLSESQGIPFTQGGRAISGGAAQQNAVQAVTSTTQTPSAETPSSNQAPAGAAAGAPPLYGATGDVKTRLFQPLQQFGEQVSGGIRQLGQEFRQQAGPTGQTYEGRGGPGAISSYVTGGPRSTTAEAEARQAARGFVGAAYTGPKELETGRVGTLGSQAEELGTRAEALRSGFGLQTVFGQGAPGLTRGEARYEARDVLSDPNYIRQVAERAQEASQVFGELTGEQTRARNLAAARTNEEAEIQRRAREDVLGRRGIIEQDLQTKVEAENKSNAARDASFAKFQETGNPEDLIGTEGLGFDPAAFHTAGAQQAEEAKRRYESILAKFPELAKFDPLKLGLTKRGKPTVQLQESGGKGAFAGGLGRSFQRGDITAPEVGGLKARQEELETLFAPRTTKGGNEVEGKFADVAPLYFGEGKNFEENLYKPQDTRPFISFDPGVRPSIQNLSSEEQRTQFNRLNDIIDEAARIEDAGEPYRAALIAGDVERYISEEEATLKSRSDSLDEGGKAWRSFVKKARSKYREATRDRNFGKLAFAVSGIGGPGGNLAPRVAVPVAQGIAGG